MAELKNNNYFVVSSFMREMGLSGTDLMVYAIIYGFSQDGHGCFKGSRKYLSELTGASVRTIQRSLNELVNRGFLSKTTVPYGEYNIIEYRTLNPNTGYLDTGCDSSAHYNINNNNSITNIMSQSDTGNDIPLFDISISFMEMFQNYPKKRNCASARVEYYNLFKGVTEDRYEVLANLISKAMTLFATDYRKHNPHDKDFNYLPTLDVWLKEDALYWIKQAEVDNGTE